MSVPTPSEPAAETAERLRAGERDPAVYVAELCDRIDEVDPSLRALVEESGRRGRLRESAGELPSRFPADDRPALYGLPVGVKDIIHVDGFTTRAGSALPPELFVGPEADCVARLREAGALVAGKTVTTEFAGVGPGLTRNPHDLDHTPGGSSSGSAAGVAAGLFPLALGTQTYGSVIRPAAFCGVVGMKPSFERVPRGGVIERSASADHVGMFTQDVEGMALAASVLCDDWESVDPSPDPPGIGVPDGAYLDRATGPALEAFESQLSRLRDAGCAVERVRVPTLADADAFGALESRHGHLTRPELAFVHHEWFDDYERFYRTGMAENIREGREVTGGQLATARASRLDLRAELEAALDDRGLDLWATPAAPGPAPETIRSTGNSVMNFPWTHAGLPAVTLPAEGTIDGLPLGIQLAGRFGADEPLLARASELADVV